MTLPLHSRLGVGRWALGVFFAFLSAASALANDPVMVKPTGEVFQDLNFTSTHPFKFNGVAIQFGNAANKVPILDGSGLLPVVNIPGLPASIITSGTFPDARIASATTWNAKENVLSFSAPLTRTTNTISLPAASGLANGYLSSTDWTTFNDKVGTPRTINTTAPLSGGGDLSTNRTLTLLTTGWPSLAFGNTTATSTATPVNLNLGGTYSSTAGANPKLILWDNGSLQYGVGVSAAQFDFMVPTGAAYVWYINGVEKMRLGSGGDLALGTNNLTMTGSIGATGARVTKGWFTDLQVTNAINGSITGNSATVTTNANLTGPITSSGNATSIAAQTGTGTTFAMSAGPTFTGAPLSPTAAADTNTTQIATTGFVIGQAGSSNPLIDGTAAPGTSLRYSRQDHVHPTDTSRAQDSLVLHLAGTETITGLKTFGADVALGTNNLTMTGSIGATGARVTKGWFTDLQVTNAITGTITGNAGSATVLQTARNIYGHSFNGAADVSLIIDSNYGGTGNGFTRFLGPTASEKTKTLRDANDTILEAGGSYNPTGSWNFSNPVGFGIGPIPSITIFVHGGTNENLGVRGHADLSSGIQLDSWNDTASGFAPMAFRSTGFGFFGGVASFYATTNTGGTAISLQPAAGWASGRDIAMALGDANQYVKASYAGATEVGGWTGVNLKVSASGTTYSFGSDLALFPGDLNVGGTLTVGSVALNAATFKGPISAADFVLGTTGGYQPAVIFIGDSIAQIVANLTATKTVTTTSGSPTVTTSSTFTDANVGSLITGTGIPSNTYIGFLNSSTSIGLSSDALRNVPVNATASGTITSSITPFGYNNYMGAGSGDGVAAVSAIGTYNGLAVAPVVGQNVAVAGKTIEQLYEDIYPLTVKFRQESGMNIAVVGPGPGTNNLGLLNDTPAMVFSKLSAFCQFLRQNNFHPVLVGLISRGNGTGGSPGGANAGQTWDQLVGAVNGLIRQNWAQLADRFVDWGVINGGSNEFAAGGYSNTTYYSADQLHPTYAGERKLAGYVQPAINDLLTYYFQTNRNQTFVNMNKATHTNVPAETMAGLRNENPSAGQSDFGFQFWNGSAWIMKENIRGASDGTLNFGATVGHVFYAGSAGPDVYGTTGSDGPPAIFAMSNTQNVAYKPLQILSSTTAGPSTGTGLELFYDTSLDYGFIQSYRHDATAAWKSLLIGSHLTKFATGGTDRVWIQNGLSVGNSNDPGAGRIQTNGTSASPGYVASSTSAGYFWEFGRDNAVTGDFVLNSAVGGGTSRKLQVTTAGGLILGGGGSDPAAGNIMLQGQNGQGGIIYFGNGIGGTKYFQWNSGVGAFDIGNAGVYTDNVVLRNTSPAANDGTIKYDGTHFYGYTGGAWKQLDN